MEELVLTRSELESLIGAIAHQLARRESNSVKPAQDDLVMDGAPPTLDPRTSDLAPELHGLARLMDHTLLKADATPKQVERLAEEALQFSFAAACVNPFWTSLLAARLRGSIVRVGTVVGFPLGATFTATKRAEAETAIIAGAQEIDMVMNVGAMRSGELALVQNDMRGVIEVCHALGAGVKVILETAYLTDEQKVTACRLAEESGADYVKTSSGFGPGGATVDDVRLMRSAVGPKVGVKAAGGIRTLDDALALLRAGASRLGTSASVAILSEAAQCLTPAASAGD
jgi:deoxyribose-phosphate aldolase